MQVAFAATVIAAVLQAVSDAGGQELESLLAVDPPLPEQVVLHGSDDAGPVTLRLLHEVLNDGRTDALFGKPTMVVIGEDGRQYWTDGFDKTVKVLSAAGEHLFSFGRQGQGPGEFEDVWNIAVSPVGAVWIYDRHMLRFSIFTSEGTFVDTVLAPWRTIMNPSSMVFLPPGELVVTTGSSMYPEWHAEPLHVFDLTVAGGRRQLVETRRLHDAPGLDPTILRYVGGGWLAGDLDGGLVYSQRTPYRITKFDRQLNVVWEETDAVALPAATDYFSFNDQGRVQFRPFPTSATVVPIGGDRYIHMLLNPPDISFAEAMASVPPLPRKLEYIEAGRDGVSRRVMFEPAGPLMYLTADRLGRLYGLWGDGQPLLIRSTVEVLTEGPRPELADLPRVGGRHQPAYRRPS